MIEEPMEEHADDDALVQEPRLWKGMGWTAKVIKNEDDEGWAVAMIKDGEPEPALVGPWTMGRDKKNPKPLDMSAFNTLVKTASEVLRRHEQQLHAQLHKSLILFSNGEELKNHPRHRAGRRSSVCLAQRHRHGGRTAGPGACAARLQIVAGQGHRMGGSRLPGAARRVRPFTKNDTSIIARHTA